MKRITKDEFITRSVIVHGDKYNYTKVEYRNNHSLVTVTCVDHGDFNVAPKNHYTHGVGCPICGISAIKYKKYTDSCKKTHEQFLIDARKIHGDNYDYSQCVYESGRTKMPIICKTHGIFMQHAEGHIHQKQGCPPCYHDRQRGSTGKSGYCSTYFETHPDKKDKQAIIYVARMRHNNDDFIKVGITTKKSVKERFYTKSKNGTVITTLLEQQQSLYDAFLKEQHILTNLSKYKYFPNRKFGGYTECFKINNHVINFIETYLNCSISIDK